MCINNINRLDIYTRSSTYRFGGSILLHQADRRRSPPKKKKTLIWSQGGKQSLQRIRHRVTWKTWTQFWVRRSCFRWLYQQGFLFGGTAKQCYKYIHPYWIWSLQESTFGSAFVCWRFFANQKNNGHQKDTPPPRSLTAKAPEKWWKMIRLPIWFP